ncbi:MAG: hypothetical protein GXO58_04735 [Thermodesulfobacteria bacterium]|nr:hypothetical protein [Thermodesulfobacteriota bacterium]
MRRFRRFLGKELDVTRATDSNLLSKWGMKVRYAPDEPDDFDEFEFGLNHKGDGDVAFLVAIEKGKIARMLFGWTVPDNPDMLKPMKDEDLEELLENKGRDLEEFFESVTK